MLYLYTILMLAWDLDADTHSHFRDFLDTFISQRKISKDIRSISNRLKENFYIPTPWVRSSKEGPNMRFILHNTSQVITGGGNVLILISPIFNIVNDFHIPIEDIHPPRNYMRDYLDEKKCSDIFGLNKLSKEDKRIMHNSYPFCEVKDGDIIFNIDEGIWKIYHALYKSKSEEMRMKCQCGQCIQECRCGNANSSPECTRCLSDKLCHSK